MTELNDLLDLLDLAIGRSADVVDAGLLDRAASLRRRLRVRGSYIEDALVVAVAGGTGSGKSSLVNGIVGDEAVLAGHLRPTTQTATAVVPDHLVGAVTPLVEVMAVSDVVAVDRVDDRILIDLPDFDSVEATNRAIVEEVLPNVDVVVWLADPEKYADPALRIGFLEPMIHYEGQFVFVLNKLDRLGDASADVIEHFREILIDIGYSHPVVVGAVSSDVGAVPVDVRDIASALSDRFTTKRAALAKAALDIRAVANDGWATCREIAVASGRDEDAIAASTFVSLGVAGYAMHARMTAPTALDRGTET